jgi:hypothetical protein
LTLEEFCALSFYTQARDAYTQINGARRAKNAAEVDPTWFAMGQAMESGLKKLQDAGLAYSGKSFRGLPAQYISEAVEGGTIMDSAFLSTSTDWSVAEDFAMRSDGQAALQYIFGQSGMSLQDISMVGRENEILFSPSQEMTVLLRHEPAPASKWDVPIVKLVLSDSSMPMNYGTTGVADAMLDFRPTGGTSGYGRTSSGIDALDLAGGVNRVGSFDSDMIRLQYLELGSDWRPRFEIEPGQATGLGEEAAGVSRHLEIETSGSRQLGNEPGAGVGLGVGRHLEVDPTGSRQLDFGPGPDLQNLGAPPVVDDAAQTGQFRLVGDYEDVQGVFRFDGVVEELPGQQATRVDVQDLDVAVGELPVQQFAVRVDADAVIDAMPDTLRTADSPAGSELSRLHESAPVVEDVASPGATAGLDTGVFRAEVDAPGASHADGGVELRGGEYPANRETINGQLGEGDYVRVPDEQPEGLSPRVVPEDTPTVVSYTDPGDAYIGRRVDAGESESRRHARGRMAEAGGLARAEWNTANPDAPRHARIPQRDDAIQAAQIAEANKAWADIPATRSPAANSGGGRQVRFGDARAIAFKIEPEFDGSELRVAADPVDTLDRSQEIRVDYFVQEPNQQWQPTRQPGFGRTASAPGEFPFSTREQLLNSLMKGESLRDSSEVMALNTEFVRARGANFSGQSKSDWRKMAMLLRDLQVTQPGDAVRVSQFADSLGRAGYNAADAAAFLARSQSQQATAFARNLDWKSLGKMLAIFESGASVT